MVKVLIYIAIPLALSYFATRNTVKILNTLLNYSSSSRIILKIIGELWGILRRKIVEKMIEWTLAVKINAQNIQAVPVNPPEECIREFYNIVEGEDITLRQIRREICGNLQRLSQNLLETSYLILNSFRNQTHSYTLRMSLEKIISTLNAINNVCFEANSN